jgi:fatty-acyl-CoA synthase
MQQRGKEGIKVELLRMTLGDQFDQTAKRFPDRDALVHVERGIRYTYQELQKITNRFAKGLLSLGLEKGDHVAIWANSIPQWIVTQIAAAKIGTPLVTINPQYQIEELRYVLQYSDTRTLVLMEKDQNTHYLKMLAELCPSLIDSNPDQLRFGAFPYLKEVILIIEHPIEERGSSESPYRGAYLFQEVLRRGERISDEVLAERQRLCQPEDILKLVFTSGTTGTPKGVMVTHYGFLNNGYLGTSGQGFTEKDRLCTAIPFHYVFTMTGLLGCFCHGAAIVSPSDTFDPIKAMTAIERERCTAIYAVPSMLVAMMEHPEFSRFNLSSLRTGVVGGAVIPIELMRRILEKLGVKEITVSYGQSENSGFVTQSMRDDPPEIRATTVGKLLPFVEVKIVNPETGETLPADGQGELCYKGFLMKGYYKMPAPTARAIDSDGWLHSGDLAQIDRRGYIRIVGRMKDVIQKDGETIFPIEIEEVLCTHPKVLDVQVIGVPDPVHNEEIAAWIRLREGEQATAEDMLGFLKGRLLKKYHPRYIKFVSSFPLTSTGKVQRFKLREEAIKEWGLRGT